MEKHAAIVLAAGRGSRMNSDLPKQFMELCKRPVLYYSLKAFEDSFVDEVVLVTGADWVEYCREEIVLRYGLKKVTQIIAGGKERYDSVYQGILALGETDYIYIHDGARPMLSQEILSRARACVRQRHACAAGMPVKDTIKIVADESNRVLETPPRRLVWQIQTPQVFDRAVIREAYDRLYREKGEALSVTDDAMVVETMLQMPVYLFEGAYDNLKITTPEDLTLAENLLA